MINISNAFRHELIHGNKVYEMSAVITLQDNTVLTLDNSNIMSNGFMMDDAVSDDNAFNALGGCIINSATLVLNNRDDSLSNYDFDNAQVVIYLSLVNEQIKKGTFRVDTPTYNGFSITLNLLDYMENFDRPYSLSDLTYPATLDEIVRDACTNCGVTFGTASYNFPHKSYVIQESPAVESTTFRDVLKWTATIAGCFARCDVNGQLQLSWFDTDTLESFMTRLDGGIFDSSTPYSTGDTADGGLFNPWNTGFVYDAGLFTQELPIHILTGLYTQTIAIDNTVITGVEAVVKVDASTTSSTAINKYTTGQAGYVVSIQDNRLINTTNAQEIVNWLGTQLIGLTFRKINIAHPNDPSIEAGDIAVVIDRKGNEYPILITRTAFSVFGRQTTVCASESPSKNSSVQYSEATKNYVESRKQLVDVKTSFEDRQDELEERIDNAGGLYKTEVTQQGATKIYYHNKPVLAESDIIMLFSDVGFTLSADGGDTWYGLTVDGVLISSILNTVGVNADWINTGELVISKQIGTETQEMFYANVDTGEVRIVADHFSLSTGDTIDSIAQTHVDAAKDEMSQQLASSIDGLDEAISKKEDTLREANEAVQQQIDNLDGIINSEQGFAFIKSNTIEGLKDWITVTHREIDGVDTPVMELGSAESVIYAVMTNKQLEFRLRTNDSPVAYIAADEDGVGKLFATNSVVVNEMRFGDWSWYQRRNGNMSVRWNTPTSSQTQSEEE